MGFFNDSGSCKPCSDYCLECDDNKCLKCKEKHPLHNNICLTGCPTYFYDSDNICEPCSSGCQTCTKDECLICDNERVINFI